MIYLFRKFNGQVILTNEQSAWDLFASDGQWKYRPIYLGAVQEAVYQEKKQALEEAVPIEPEDYLKENRKVLRAALPKREKLEQELFEELAKLADKTIKPANTRVSIVRDEDTPNVSDQKIKGMIVGI